MTNEKKILIPEIVQPESDPRTVATKGDVASLVKAARDHQVTDPESDRIAADLLARVKQIGSAVEKRRKEITAPVNRLVKETNAFYRKLLEPLAEAERVLKQRFADYRRRMQEEADRKRREEEARRRAEEEAARKKAADADPFDDLFDDAPSEPPAPPAPAAPPVEVPDRKVSTEGGATVSTRKRAKFRVTDVDKVPRSFLIVNEKAIGAAVRAGVREIDGVEIWEEDEVQVRGAGGAS